ncbi:HutD family protein [Dongia sp.]|uniref:HutD/Ves family protein n=1 Tax=Dongia sp. TaxID=1977262 RepID=UPI003751A5CD
MKLTHLGPADYKTMPWKNGGGTTTELMAEPAGAADYDWRISIADVAQSGPFSDFAGYQRNIMLVEGAGFTLEFDDQPAQRLSRTFQPFCFDGAWRTHCTLIDGPVKDFNLIARQGSGALLDVVRLIPGNETIPPARTMVLHLFRGQAAACGRNLAAGESLRIDGADAPIDLAAARPSILAFVRIGARP